MLDLKFEDILELRQSVEYPDGVERDKGQLQRKESKDRNLPHTIFDQYGFGIVSYLTMLYRLQKLFALLSIGALAMCGLFFSGFSRAGDKISFSDQDYLFNMFRLGALPTTETSCRQRFWPNDSSSFVDAHLSCTHGSMSSLTHFGMVANGSATIKAFRDYDSGTPVGLAFCQSSDILNDGFSCSDLLDTI
jgi:hypothetical protein